MEPHQPTGKEEEVNGLTQHSSTIETLNLKVKSQVIIS